jgi:hypothetical protein
VPQADEHFAGFAFAEAELVASNADDAGAARLDDFHRLTGANAQLLQADHISRMPYDFLHNAALAAQQSG